MANFVQFFLEHPVYTKNSITVKLMFTTQCIRIEKKHCSHKAESAV